jgi:hypothetical protein
MSAIFRLNFCRNDYSRHAQALQYGRAKESAMTTTLWIVLAVSVIAVFTFVVAIRSLIRENREIDKKIDYTKLRPWQDDDDE